ncbi:MAG: GyrI-like domain-containing protein [Methanocalculaceae archaeon]|nr:GyrI-like domain-containing protein [Methanocalculaceae archaeon]
MSPVFAENIGILYALSYAVRMMPKQGYTPEGFEPYTVYPLEGVWGLVDPSAGIEDKNNFSYTLMMRQPGFVTEEIAERATDAVRKKKPQFSVGKAMFGTMEDGLSVQMMHIGSYDDEPAGFAQMKQFLLENNLERRSLLHREIYLSDARRNDPAKQKTVLRWTVRQIPE